MHVWDAGRLMEGVYSGSRLLRLGWCFVLGGLYLEIALRHARSKNTVKSRHQELHIVRHQELYKASKSRNLQLELF